MKARSDRTKGAKAPYKPDKSAATLLFDPELCASFLLGKTVEQAGVYLLTHLKKRLGNQRFRWEADWTPPSDQYVFESCFKEAD